MKRSELEKAAEDHCNKQRMEYSNQIFEAGARWALEYIGSRAGGHEYSECLTVLESDLEIEEDEKEK